MFKEKYKRKKKLTPVGFDPAALSFYAVGINSSLFKYFSKWG